MPAPSFTAPTSLHSATPLPQRRFLEISLPIRGCIVADHRWDDDGAVALAIVIVFVQIQQSTSRASCVMITYSNNDSREGTQCYLCAITNILQINRWHCTRGSIDDDDYSTKGICHDSLRLLYLSPHNINLNFWCLVITPPDFTINHE